MVAKREMGTFFSVFCPPLPDKLISHNMSLNGFRKSTAPPNRQPLVLIRNSEQKVDDFVGELTF